MSLPLSNYGEEQVPCQYCDVATTNTGTKLCNRCWELERRIERDPVLALKIMAKLDKVPEGAWKRMYTKHTQEMNKVETEHKALVAMMSARHQKEREDLEAKCLADHGHHLGDGGFLYSSCVRCGLSEVM